MTHKSTQSFRYCITFASIVDLIEMLYLLGQSQYRDIKRALIPGFRNLSIVPSFEKITLQPVHWGSKSKQSQRNYFYKFLKSDLCTKRHAVASSDGQLAVLKGADGGKKKTQVKRKRTAKTSTIPRKPN